MMYDYTTETLATPNPHLYQSADGRPHLAYYDRDNSLSFCWSGEMGEPIEVSSGGAGEPVTYLIHLADTRPVIPAPHWFQRVCVQWLAQYVRGEWEV